MIQDRMRLQPCPIGSEGFCCKICLMGPCRVIKDGMRSLCGASQSLIVARNILRFTAGGAAAHCGHAYHLLDYLEKEIPRGYLKSKVPSYIYDIWESLGISVPQNGLEHFKDISEALHLSTLGVNSDYQDILKWCLKLGIIDGYYGLSLATELEDEKFGKTEIVEAELNLDCIDSEKINIAVHGHEIIVADALVRESYNDPEINLIGICCTGATLLAKHGIPLSANFILQEDVIATGMIEAIVVDVECIMPSLAELCECFQTKLITTNEIARIPNAIHLPAKNESEARNVARKIIEIAKENRSHRKKELEKQFRKKPKDRKKVVAGFNEDNIDIPKIAEKLRRKEIKGIIGVVGCVNPRANSSDYWVAVFKKLSHDYIIFATGCMAFEFGKENLLDGERFFHLGSCVNNARIAEIFKRISEYLGEKIIDLPFLISAPMPITEKSMSIALFFASIGCSIHSGYPYLLSSDQNIAPFLSEVFKTIFHSKVFLESAPERFYEEIVKGGLKGDWGKELNQPEEQETRESQPSPAKVLV